MKKALFKGLLLSVGVIATLLVILIISVNKKPQPAEKALTNSYEDKEKYVVVFRPYEKEEGVELPEDIANILNCEAEYYGYYSFDLNADEKKEFIVFPEDFCGEFNRGASGNGPILVFQDTGNEWKEIGNLEGNRLTVLETLVNGYHSLASYHHTSGLDGVETIFEYKASADGEDGAYVSVAESETKTTPISPTNEASD